MPLPATPPPPKKNNQPAPTPIPDPVPAPTPTSTCSPCPQQPLTTTYPCLIGVLVQPVHRHACVLAAPAQQQLGDQNASLYPTR